MAQKDTKSSPVNYYSSVSFADNKQFPVGCRMLIVYKMQNGLQPYTTGTINLYGYAMLNSTEASVLTGTPTSTTNGRATPLSSYPCGAQVITSTCTPSCTSPP